MALPTKRNLGDLRQELAARLGFAAQGSMAGPNLLTFNSFLRTAQTFLYEDFDWLELKKTTDIACGVGQRFYDYPDDCDPNQINAIVLEDNTSGTPKIHPLTEGIDWSHDNYTTPYTIPRRYERRDQIEVWPIPDSASYDIRIEYIKRLGRFTQDADLATIQEDIILTLAIADGKAHYEHRDANVYLDRASRLLGKLKKKNMGNERFVRPNKAQKPKGDGFNMLTHVNTLDL